MTRFAVISDIHGNLLALKAVLDDIRKEGIGEILNLGDSVHGPLEPEEKASRLIELSVISIKGNQDREIPERTRRSLSGKSLEWLASLPATSSVLEGIFLCHGTPRSDEEYLLEDIGTGEGILKQEAVIMALLSGVSERVILCGHSHKPRIMELSDGRLIVNPGSVGLQAYSDETPLPHTMETGSPHARYAILLKEGAKWKAKLKTIPYDSEKAAVKAAANGRKDWEKWLREGRSKG